MLLTDIRDKKREEEKKAAEVKQASADKENSKTNEKTAPSLTTGKSKFFPIKKSLVIGSLFQSRPLSVSLAMTVVAGCLDAFRPFRTKCGTDSRSRLNQTIFYMIKIAKFLLLSKQLTVISH